MNLRQYCDSMQFLPLDDLKEAANIDLVDAATDVCVHCAAVLPERAQSKLLTRMPVALLVREAVDKAGTDVLHSKKGVAYGSRADFKVKYWR